MEVILIKDVENLGYANDIVNVKPGYANNYLIPQGFAKAATASAKKVLAENLRQRAHKDAKILADAQAQADKVRAESKNLAAEAKKAGYAQADNLEKEAKNPIAKIAAKKAADKVRKESDDKAKKIESEGNQKADGQAQ